MDEMISSICNIPICIKDRHSNLNETQKDAPQESQATSAPRRLHLAFGRGKAFLSQIVGWSEGNFTVSK